MKPYYNAKYEPVDAVYIDCFNFMLNMIDQKIFSQKTMKFIK